MLGVTDLLVAQSSFTVTRGTSSEYHIDAQPNITTYTWQVFDNADLTSLTGSPDVVLTTLGAGREHEIGVTWNALGTYYLTVTVLDAENCSNRMAYTFEVIANDLPVLAEDFNATVETEVVTETGTNSSGNLLVNDSDPDGGVLSITSINGISSGTVVGIYGTLNWFSNGDYTYVPNSELDSLTQTEVLTEVFTYAVSDGQGGTASSTLTITIEGVNAIPILVDDSNSTIKSDPVNQDNGSGNLLANDLDADGDLLTITSVNGNTSVTVVGTYGTFTWSNDGNYTYTPNPGLDSLDAGESVVEIFTYHADDPYGGFDTAVLKITINGDNDAPVLANDVNRTTESNSVSYNGPNSSGGLLANDTDSNGDALSITQIDGVLTSVGAVNGIYGRLTWLANGRYTYTPNTELDSLDAGENVVETFTYTATDGKGGTGNATLTITINGLNDVPVLVDDTNTTVETLAVNQDDGSGSLLNNDSDPNGNSLTVTKVNGVNTAVGTISGTYGTLTWLSNGTYTYTPNTELDTLTTAESLQEVFTYTASDGLGGISTATLTITIDGANANPVLADDSNSTIETNAISEDDGSGNILSNDTDLDGDVLMIASIDGVSNTSTDITGTYGTLNWNTNGTYTYTPNASMDSLAVTEAVFEDFAVTVTDGNGGTSVSTLTITINGQNAAPLAVNDTNSTTETTSVTQASGSGNLLANDSDIDNDLLRVWQIDGNPAITLTGTYGTLIWNSNGTYTYVPNSELDSLKAGESVHDIFTYSCGDGNGGTDDALLNITINGQNSAPVLANDINSTIQNNPIDETDGSGSLLSNDDDIDGNTLTVTHINGISTATGTITGTYGTLTWLADGTYDYTPNAGMDTLIAGESLQEIFTYTATDGIVNGTASLTITISGSNVAPVLANDTNNTIETTVIHYNSTGSSGNLVANDTDANGDALTVTHINGIPTATGTIAGTYGTLTWLANGRYTYMPNSALDSLTSAEILTETFIETVSDGNGETGTSSLTITIYGENDLPVLANDTNNTIETNAVTEADGSGNFLSNDIDAEGAALIIASIDGVNNPATDVIGTFGTLNWNTNGTYTYTPNSALDSLEVGESVIENFTVTVTDGAGGSATSTLTITINGQNAAPVAVNDTNNTTERTVITNSSAGGSGRLLVNDTDIDNDALTVWQINGVATITGTVMGIYGTLVWNGNGTYTYTPNAELDSLEAGESIVEIFTYSCGDGNGGTDDATLTITINGQNAVPVLVNDTNLTTEIAVINETHGSGNLLANDTDADLQILMITSIDGDITRTLTGIYGTLTWNTNGHYTYTPNAEMDSLAAGENVSELFTYIATDGTVSGTATLAIIIRGANTNPVLLADSNNTIKTTAVNQSNGSGNLLINDTDPDGDALRVYSIGGALTGTTIGTYGSLIWNPDGTYTYIPNAGLDSLTSSEIVTEIFEYVVRDGKGGSSLSTLTITIAGENEAPVLFADTNSTVKAGAVSENNGSGNLLANDIDPDNDLLTIININGNSTGTLNGLYGTLIWNADGTYTYQPLADMDSLSFGESLTEVFTYAASDGIFIETSTLTITLNGINTNPVALDDSNSTIELIVVTETNGSGNLIDNDSDADGDALSVSSVNGNTTGFLTGNYGILNWNFDGTYSYSPNSNLDTLKIGESVTENFEYTVSDGNGGTATATLSITIDGENQSPVAVNDTNITTEGVSVNETNGSGNLLANDSDVDGDLLAVFSINGVTTSIVAGSYGTITWNVNGNYSYVPNSALDSLASGEEVTEIFNIVVVDVNGNTSTSTLTITITGTEFNMPPVANTDFVTIVEDSPAMLIDVASNDTDPENGSLTISIILSPISGGTAVVNGNGVTYQAPLNYNGTDYFVYQICDNASPSLCDVDTVFVVVTPVNDLPVATNDTNETKTGIAVTETAGSGNLLQNDTDVDGDLLVITEINGDFSGLITGTYGTLNWDINGTYTYTPFDVETEIEETLVEVFTYQISDGNGGVSSSQLIINIIPSNRSIEVDASAYCFQDAPYINYTITPINFNDTNNLTVDVYWYDSNNVLVLTLVDQPLAGNILWPGAQIDESGYATNWPGWVMVDGIWVEGSDGYENTRTGSRVKFKVNPEALVESYYPPATPDCYPGPALELHDDVASVNSGESINIDVLSNDSGVSGSDVVTVVIGTPEFGDYSIDTNGIITYTPDSNYNGNDTIIYVVTNSSGSDTAIVVINVVPIVQLTTSTHCVNDVPYYSWNIETTGFSIDAIDLRIFNSNNELVETFRNVPLTGSKIWPGTPDIVNGALYNVPAVMETINVEIEYVINENGLSLSSELYAPNCHYNMVIATMDTMTIYGEETILQVLDNDFDPDEGEIDFSSLRIITNTTFKGPYNGKVFVNTNGTITYIPNPGYMGLDSFIYQICDNYTDVACDTAIVLLNVLYNDELVANSDHFTIYRNQQGVLNVAANDFDPEFQLDLTSIVIIVDPENGNAIATGNGTVTYQPLPDFVGTDSFQYVICDKGLPADCDSAWVYINVRLNECITAVWDDTITDVNQPVVINVLVNDFDFEEEMDSFTLAIVKPVGFDGPYHGNVTVNSDRTITYVPDNLFAGIDSFVYSVCDKGYPVCCDTAVVYVSVIDNNIGVVANRDDVSTPEGQSIVIPVLVNDYDTDGNIDSNSIIIVSLPQSGTTVVDHINGTITYQPNTGFSGLDSMVYSICDNGPIVTCDTAIIYIKVAENLPPVALNDTIIAFWGVNKQYTISINDYDPEGQLNISSVSIVNPPTSGGIAINQETGVISYMPDYCATSVDSFTYVIYDLHGNVSNIATVYINISIDPEGDYDMDGVLDIAEDINSNGNPCDDDTDGDGVINFQDDDDDGDGVLTINEDIDLDGNPTNDDTDGDGKPDYLDTDDDDDCVLTADEIAVHGHEHDLDGDGIPDYLDWDNNGDGMSSCDQLADLDGNGIPDWDEIWISRALNDVIYIGLDEIADIDIFQIMANDSSQMDSITFEIIMLPGNGILTINYNDWTINYTPNVDFIGVDSIQYVICDFYGRCDSATVYINVIDIIIPPQLFTPNNDGENDYYVIRGLNRYSTNNFQVFNRWGNKVYEKINYNQEWDGYANVRNVVGNKQLPVGVYYYIIEYGNQRKRTGALFLER